MTAKERLRQLVEDLSDREAEAALDFVKRNRASNNKTGNGASKGERSDEVLDRAIVEGYRRHPPSDPWGDSAARHLIEAEPW